MRFSLLALIGFVTFVAVVVRIAIPYPEFAAFLFGGFPVWGTLLICIVIGIFCPIVALVRWVRGPAKSVDSAVLRQRSGSV